ncbi:MAG: hypothetical protein J7J01_01385 [Methanophagales archaeon]|nr:hypothetical protein [Methanophagales archaeon]
MTGGNMGVRGKSVEEMEKLVEELKKRVEELEKESKAFRGLVTKREGLDVKSEQLRKEWFREANQKYFSKKRVVKNTAEDLATNIALGKSVSLDKIIRKIEQKVGVDVAKTLDDVADEREMLQRLKAIEIAVAKAYREDKELQRKLDLAKKGRRLSLYYRAKVIDDLKRTGDWKEMTIEELEAEIEAHKNVIGGGA